MWSRLMSKLWRCFQLKKFKKKAAGLAVTAVVAVSAISLSAFAAYNKLAGDVNGDSKVTQADAVLAARKKCRLGHGGAGFRFHCC